MTGSVPRIERAQPGDAPRMAELHRSTVIVAYAEIFPAASEPPTLANLTRLYSELLERSDATVLAHTDPATGQLAGQIALVADPAVPAGHRIERFNVRPGSQGLGLGQALYEEILGVARAQAITTLNLWVLEANERARRIYERWGWRHVPGWAFENDPPEVIDVLYELDLPAGDSEAGHHKARR